MTIEILPARLANQIAAGEVVERPASVVKELVENSLDAGATSIKIDIDKGGAKRIRISDNGCGIVKEELTLALSRHATSKIKNLSDLEAICSLGFRGEALASISSVARLTLTSKPQAQDTAWQACAQGRDMDVVIQPAAHANGTTIDVVDLFFNTPARRKFLRTEKTEFGHIEEVIKRIALARFDVAFTLTHNGKIIRQYRVANSDTQRAKRVAQVCGQSFIDHALVLDCQHDGLHLSGWIAQPSFSRNQNDLCYSYVNGRMMRDKLINHAIRQAYQEMLPNDSYPAFVLFLDLDAKDVDVNVHPAKHEVRFHQGRYVHDFIYSVCHQALNQQMLQPTEMESLPSSQEYLVHQHQAQTAQALDNAYQQTRAYVNQLQTSDKNASQSSSSAQRGYDRTQNSSIASQAYQDLMTPLTSEQSVAESPVDNKQYLLSDHSLHFVAPAYALYFEDELPRLLSLAKLKMSIQLQQVKRQWQDGLTSQPLLLPIKLQLSEAGTAFIRQHNANFVKMGMVVKVIANTAIQILQFPALLRHKDVNQCFTALLTKLCELEQAQGSLNELDWQHSIVQTISGSDLDGETFDKIRMQTLYQQLTCLDNQTINQLLLLNSVALDLTSAIQALN